MKHIVFTIIFLLNSLFIFSQNYIKVKLNKKEKQTGIQSHWQRDATDGHYVMFDLFLYRNGQYEYLRTDNLYPEYSNGSWTMSENQLIIRSRFQKNELPVKISYIPSDTNGKRKIAQIRNLKNDIIEAYSCINTDSTMCYYGDQLCKGSYDNIERVKVGLENSELQSPWIKVKQGNETIQLIIDTDLNIKKYSTFTKVFLVSKNKIIEIHN